MVPLTAMNTSSNSILINTTTNKIFIPNPNPASNHSFPPSLKYHPLGALPGRRRGRSGSCHASLFSSISDTLTGKSKTSNSSNVDLVGTVQILKEGVFDIANHAALDLIGQSVKLYLVSLDLDAATKEGKISQAAYLKFDSANAKDSGESNSLITVKFSVPKDFGKPGALLVNSDHENEFFLKSVTVKLADGTTTYFPCHSWIQDIKLNQGKQRVFFTNQPYLPSETPAALKNLRNEDLVLLRGDGTGERQTGERIYDYDIYNDLGNADDKSKDRPNLGGNAKYPYPRRCRTGRPKAKSDKTTETALTPLLGKPYIPRDETFSPTKNSMFTLALVRCFGHDILPVLQNLLTLNKPFDDFDEIHDMYVDDLKGNQSPSSRNIFINPTDGTPITFPRPGVVIANIESWCSDQEFARQRLAGVNPMCIQRLTEFPIKSALDEAEYGPAESAITRADLERYLDGLTVEQAIEKNQLYILDYHEAILPLVNAVNEGGDGDGRIYAARTVFHLREEGFLLPIAIELTLPPNQKTGRAVNKRVLTLPTPGVVDWEWRLAKTHVSILDAGIHELVSHWLRTHACVEPFIIATHRQLSTMHPLHIFLEPHFKDTMHINSLARAALINAGGIIELGFTPGKYSISISSLFYKGWRFDEQALPQDLIKRGMAVKDETAKHGVKLLIEDYPYAEDGLEVWAAIEKWTKAYVGIYYPSDETVKQDTELQAWWKEIREVGHGDHAAADWWLPMDSVQNLTHILTTILWVTSGHHAAVNFGQYAYFGYMPNMPSKSKQLIPERDTPEYKKMLADPEAFFLKTVSSQGEAILVMATVELLAQHMGEEEYLGDRADNQWTNDSAARSALDRFRESLKAVDETVEERAAAATVLSHRKGPALLPYTLLAPSSGEGLTFRGVPNSISI